MACSIAAEYDAQQHLPDELLETLFYHFSGTTIGRAQAVCRRWNGILLAITNSTNIWFRRCKEEIPKYTLMQMCNHPVELRYRSRAEWKDVYVRWRNFRGRTLLGRAELEPKMVVSNTNERLKCCSWGRHYRIPPCFTDDVAFFYDRTNVEAFDLHSGASVKTKIKSNPCDDGVKKFHTLGMTVPINAEGKTTFEANVEKSVLIFVFDDQFEILIGLEPKLAVQLPISAVGGVSTWFDTILVETDGTDGHRLQVYRVHFLTDGENKQVSVDHIQSFCIDTPGEAHSLIDLMHGLLLTGNKALMLLEWTHLMIFDIAKGEECGSLSLNRRWQFSHIGLMSWVGSTVAVTENKDRNDVDHDIHVGQPVIILYFLDEECERLLSITRLDPHDIISAFSLLYDDSIIMINSNKCNVLLFTRGDQDADKWSRDEILECSPVAVQEAKGHSEQIEQDGEHGNESLFLKSRDATCDTVDEANSYKGTMSNLLGIDLGDPLWKNFDAEMNHASHLSNKENDGGGSCSGREEQEGDGEGSCTVQKDWGEDWGNDEEGNCSGREDQENGREGSCSVRDDLGEGQGWGNGREGSCSGREDQENDRDGSCSVRDDLGEGQGWENGREGSCSVRDDWGEGQGWGNGKEGSCSVRDDLGEGQGWGNGRDGSCLVRDDWGEGQGWGNDRDGSCSSRGDKENDREGSCSSRGDQENDIEGSFSSHEDQENDGECGCTSHEVYIIERWKGERTDHALSQLVRGSVIHKPILSVPHQGYATARWKYNFTSSSVAIEPRTIELEDRLYVYKWNYMQ